jgi:hypothetical protein
MAYIGLAPVNNFLTTFSERYSGDGNTLQFILSRSVSRAEDLEVFIGSTQQLPSVYTATGTELTFATPPAGGTDNITVIYRAGALQALDTTRVGNPAGSAASPSLYFTSGTNTGIYWPSSTSLAVATQGVRRIEVSAATGATSTTTGALQVAGGVGLTGNLYAGGIVRLTDETESSATSGGALVVSGGVGIAKNLNVGGDIQVTGDFTVAGTFTTTASDSLAINDPFLFLATNNSGDSLDTGFVSKYVDGATVERYSGFFRDVTDGAYKLFANLTVQPSTTVNTGDASFRLADLTLNSLSAGGTISATSGTASSSTTTGAVVITGGLGVSGAIYAANLELSSGAINTTGAIGNVASVESSGVIRTVGIIYANANLASSSTTTGALRVTGGVGVSGNINAGNIAATNLTGSGIITINSGNNVTAIVNGGTNGVGNVGSSTTGFNTVFAKSTSAQYADLAENYLADAVYEPGTVVHFGGDQEVTLCDIDMCARVAGVVSTAPAHLMNTGLVGEHVVALALTGRVPTKVQGTVAKGDMMVSAGNGRARAEVNPRVGSVIGKALEDFNGDEGVIEVVVGRV